MSEQYTMVQPGGDPIHLIPEFDTEAEAQTFATSVGIGGAIETLATFNAGAYQAAVNLVFAKRQKLFSLKTEGERRSILVDAGFPSVVSGYAASLAVNALTGLGSSWAAVGVAWNGGRIDIDALPNIAAVDAYDVVTDPAWP